MQLHKDYTPWVRDLGVALRAGAGLPGEKEQELGIL